jgi:dTDP-4-amino-4,6-dideoxygalactose transaminase
MMRTLPPSGVPITFFDICAGLVGAIRGSATLERFRADICTYFGVRHCFLLSSGRAALSLLLTALHQANPERNEVVVPAYTSFSVPSAVVNAGLRVALYDLQTQTLSPDLDSLERVLTDRTLCIVVCHLYGYPCDMEAVRALAVRKGIPVVDDAAQAMGATFKGKFVGTLGAAGLFSLSRGKNISTVDGGIIVTDSDGLADLLSRVALQPTGFIGSLLLLIKAVLLSLMLRPRLYWLPARLPFLKLGASVYAPDFPLQCFTPFQSGIGRRMLSRLTRITTDRINNAAAVISGCVPARKELFVQPVEGATPVFLRLPVIVSAGPPQPDPVLGIVKSYPAPLNEIEDLQAQLVNDSGFPGAKFLAEHLLTLPTHEFVTAADIAKIVAAVTPSRN